MIMRGTNYTRHLSYPLHLYYLSIIMTLTQTLLNILLITSFLVKYDENLRQLIIISVISMIDTRSWEAFILTFPLFRISEVR